jgi:hypothetical protein
MYLTRRITVSRRPTERELLLFASLLATSGIVLSAFAFVAHVLGATAWRPAGAFADLWALLQIPAWVAFVLIGALAGVAVWLFVASRILGSDEVRRFALGDGAERTLLARLVDRIVPPAKRE